MSIDPSIERRPLVRPERASDIEAIRAVNLAAFGASTEADLVDALREAGDVTLSVVAESDGDVVGHVLFSPMQIIGAEDSFDAIALAQMAVNPTFQSQGIGGLLTRKAIELLRHQEHRLVFVLGHPHYYPRFGFSAERAVAVECPFGGGGAWMVLELVEDAMQGVCGRATYCDAFEDLA